MTGACVQNMLQDMAVRLVIRSQEWQERPMGACLQEMLQDVDIRL